MTDLNAMALFVRVVEAGSMSAAARLLNLPKSSISRRIALLEHELNATLLHRSTRSLSLTDTGRIYYERARPIVVDAQQAELEIRSRHSRAVGIVRISATTGFGQKVLAPVVCELLRDEPELKIDLRLTDERLNIIEDGLDLAVRMGALDDADLLSRRLTMVTRVLCASPDYLEANGTPDAPADLARHSCIVTSAALNRWRFEDQSEIAVPWRLAAGNVLLACDAAVGGHGIALLPRFLAAEHLEAGRLVQVLPDFPLPRSEATVLYPRDRIPSVATKTVIEALVKTLARREL
jgi:DNA-binding transcriptional LysR family regulator